MEKMFKNSKFYIYMEYNIIINNLKRKIYTTILFWVEMGKRWKIWIEAFKLNKNSNDLLWNNSFLLKELNKTTIIGSNLSVRDTDIEIETAEPCNHIETNS